MAIDIGAIITAFCVGFAMKRGGLCTYAAALQIVRQRKFNQLLDFLGAASWAALVVVPLAWWLPQWVGLSGTRNGWLTATAGCVFGTFVQLVGGNINYLTTLLGMALGVALAEITLIDITHATHLDSPVQQAAIRLTESA